MAQAMLAGLLRAGHAPEHLLVADPDPEQRQRLNALHQDLMISADNGSVAANAEVLVLAVKPQVMAAIAWNLGPRPQTQLVVSIAAGITLKALGEWLGSAPALVRVMPNQPALVGAGMAAMVASAGVSERQREQADYVMAATGTAGWLQDEDLMDAVTAVSGSGPAYFYLLMEILEDFAGEAGIDPQLSRQLAVETARGAGLTARESSLPPAELRRKVTSPGGTTEAALLKLEAAGIREIFRAALLAALRRSQELGQSGG